MICLLVWPCSDMSHNDCYGIVDMLSMLLDRLAGQREEYSLIYLAEHLSYDEACQQILQTHLVSDRLYMIREGLNMYDLVPCSNQSHRTCYSVIDITESMWGELDVYVVEHVSYAQALKKLLELWQKIEKQRAGRISP